MESSCIRGGGFGIIGHHLRCVEMVEIVNWVVTVQSHSKSSRTPGGTVTQNRYTRCIIMNGYLAARGISYVGFWSNRGVEVHVHNITSAMCFLCHGTSRGARTFGMRLYSMSFYCPVGL